MNSRVCEGRSPGFTIGGRCKIETEKTMANGKENLLKEARSLLSSIQKQGQVAIFQDSRQAAEALRCSITLIESFHRSVVAGQGPVPSSPDWKVVNAVLGLLVRLGICPYLSPGVGIASETMPENAGVIAAASAISEHLSGFATSDSPRFRNIDTLSSSESHILFVSGEVLASLVWDECADINGSPKTAATAAMSSLGQLVLHSYLWHMVAAYLQLACCPKAAQSSEDGIFRQIARKRVKSIVEGLPVRQVVEACFILLHRSSPGPPEWLKSEVGKQLSKLVMRRGGVAVVLEELVGRATEGNVEVYDKVAAHLAKIPKSIATVDDYFRAICPQLPPLLLLCSKVDDPNEGETSGGTIKSLHFTATSLACKLFSVDPALADRYLLEPLLGPLLSWSSDTRGIQNANQDLSGGTFEKRMDGKQTEGSVSLPTEKQLVASVEQLSVLLTAGHRTSELVKETVLLKTKDIAPLLFKLHFHLEAADGSSNSWASGSFRLKGKKSSQSNRDECKSLSSYNAVGKGIAKGFLDKGLAVQGETEATADKQSALFRLRYALADFVMAHTNQSLEVALPTVLSLLFQPGLSFPSWPTKQGEIWDSLRAKPAQPSNPAMYLSSLLLAIENWPLTVAILGELLQKVLDLRHSTSAVQGHRAIELLGYVQDFELLNNEVGSKALERDPRGAASLVKMLLENKSIALDEDLLELVLHMINSVLKGFSSSWTSGGSVQKGRSDQMDSGVLADMALALERVCSNACLSEKVRQMSFTLAQECFSLCNIPPTE